jgi:hypothetical protein
MPIGLHRWVRQKKLESELEPSPLELMELSGQMGRKVNEVFIS